MRPEFVALPMDDAREIAAGMALSCTAAERLAEIEEFLKVLSRDERSRRIHRVVKLPARDNPFLRPWNRLLFGGAGRCWAKMAICCLEGRVIIGGYASYVENLVGGVISVCDSGERYEDLKQIYLQAAGEITGTDPAGRFGDLVDDKVAAWQGDKTVPLAREEAIAINQRVLAILDGSMSLSEAGDALFAVGIAIEDSPVFETLGSENRLVRLLAKEGGMEEALLAAADVVHDIGEKVEEVMHEVPVFPVE